MKRRSLITAFILPFLTMFFPSIVVADSAAIPLFNGKDLTGWKVVNGTGTYSVEDGCIVGTGKNIKHNTFLRTEKTYKNFDFSFEMKFDDLTGNSGVMFRGLQKEGADGRVFGYQCEHDNRKDRAWTAGLYDEARRGWLHPSPLGKSSTPEQKTLQEAFTAQGNKIFRWNDWNTIRIRCQDCHIQIWLNGEARVDFHDNHKDFTPEGFFGLQIHGGKSCNVRWRNLLITPL
jgi:hypothetical protein